MVSSSLRTAVLLLAALVVFPACDSAEEFVIGGTYVGRVANGTAVLTLEVPETATGGPFEFSLTSGGSDVEVTGTGTYDHPSISIVIPDPGPTPDDVAEGTVSEDGGVITLDAGDGPFELRRQ